MLPNESFGLYFGEMSMETGTGKNRNAAEC